MANFGIFRILTFKILTWQLLVQILAYSTKDIYVKFNSKTIGNEICVFYNNTII